MKHEWKLSSVSTLQGKSSGNFHLILQACWKFAPTKTFPIAAFPLQHLAHPNLRHRQQFFLFRICLVSLTNRSFVHQQKKIVKSYENVGTFTSHRVICGSSASGDIHKHQITAFHAEEQSDCDVQSEYRNRRNFPNYLEGKKWIVWLFHAWVSCHECCRFAAINICRFSLQKLSDRNSSQDKNDENSSQFKDDEGILDCGPIPVAG